MKIIIILIIFIIFINNYILSTASPTASPIVYTITPTMTPTSCDKNFMIDCSKNKYKTPNDCKNINRLVIKKCDESGLANVDLSSVKRADELIIKNNTFTTLESLGLTNLQRVSFFKIKDNSMLESLDGLSSLRVVKEFRIVKNKELYDYGDLLDNFEQIKKTLKIQHNDFDNLEILANNTRLKGDLLIAEDIDDFSDTDSLKTIKGTLELRNTNEKNNGKTKSGFNSLTNIKQDFIVQGYDVDGFKNVKKVGSFLLYKSELKQFNGLKKLKEVNSTFEIRNCDKLKSVSGLKNLETLTSLTVIRNKKLSKLSLGVLNVDKKLLITNNNGLKSISLSKVEKIGILLIQENKKLKSISLKNVKKIRNLIIKNNENLKKNSFKKLTTLRNVIFSRNKKLKSLSGFNKVDTVKGYIKIYGSASDNKKKNFKIK